MASAKKVALVTGSNKGIGFAIVQGLCERLGCDDWDIYVLSRDVGRGQEAVEKLKQLGHKPAFHQLAIDDDQSRKNIVTHLKEKHQNRGGYIDILVNNAAIAYPSGHPLPRDQQAYNTIAINFTATKAVCDELFPLLRPHARVVNISSSCGMLYHLPGSDIKKRLLEESMTEEGLLSEVNEYLEEVGKGMDAVKAKGYSTNEYIMSKVFLTKLTIIQQKNIDQQRPNDDVLVNACHPGYVDTDMTNHKGPLTPTQGAQAPLKLALLPPNDPSNPRGQMHWFDGKQVEWTAKKYD